MVFFQHSSWLDMMGIAESVLILFDRIAVWCAETDGTVLMLQAGAAVLIIEWVRRRCRKFWTVKAFESCFANLLMILMNGALAPLFAILVGWADASYGVLSFPHLSRDLWAETPAWVLILMILFGIDFCDYWLHRGMHVFRWLWAIHAIHHSDPHPTVLTTGRVHLLEPVLMQIMYLVFLTWLSLPFEVLGAVGGLRILHNMYTHMNVDWGHGPFRYLIASPRFHRWHHADVPAAYGKNLANLFPFLDIMFGTHYVPGTCREEMGAQGIPEKPLDMVAWPLLQWYGILRRRFASFFNRRTETERRDMSQIV